MKKEIIICIIIIIIVCILNYITAKYTERTVNIIDEELSLIKEKIKKSDNVSEEIVKLKDEWDNRYNKMAYYLEHNELEQVYLYLIGMESSYNSHEYTEAIKELDKCVYTLQHINEKYSFSLKNIF